MEERIKGRVRVEIGRADRRGIGTPKNVGAKTFGSGQPNKSSECEANSLSSCTQRLLGTDGYAG